MKKTEKCLNIKMPSYILEAFKETCKLRRRTMSKELRKQIVAYMKRHNPDFLERCEAQYKLEILEGELDKSRQIPEEMNRLKRIAHAVHGCEVLYPNKQGDIPNIFRGSIYKDEDSGESHEKGLLLYSNLNSKEDKFEGHILSGTPLGGILTYRDGTSFEGYFKKGNPYNGAIFNKEGDKKLFLVKDGVKTSI